MLAASSCRSKPLPGQVHPNLKVALVRLRQEQDRPRGGPVIRSERGGFMPARIVVNWSAGVYQAAVAVIGLARAVVPLPGSSGRLRPRH
jgi:hypothetical protein